jgi:adenine-specific DNA-methyltransferase
VGLLNDGGELIFIVPSDFMKLTGSVQLIDEMMLQGTFTHIIHPKDEHLFENAAIDVMVFRYCKDESLGNDMVFNGEKRWLVHHHGTLSFVLEEPDVSVPTRTIADYFHVYVGMVSGKENVFKNQDLGNVDVLNGNGDKEKYIIIDKFPTDNPTLNAYMTEHKPQLMERKIRAFNEKNWYEWGALRNYNTMQKRVGEQCIYVRTVTRNNIVAFAGTVGPIGGNLLALIPKSYVTAEPAPKNNPRRSKSKATSKSKESGACLDMTQERIHETITYLNSAKFKNEFVYSGRFKIGHRQLANASLNL